MRLVNDAVNNAANSRGCAAIASIKLGGNIGAQAKGCGFYDSTSTCQPFDGKKPKAIYSQ
jgi:hypothetical protein